MSLGRRLRRSLAVLLGKERTLSGVDSSRGWTTLFSSETRPGGWQQDDEAGQNNNTIRYGPVYACATLIASDIGKIYLRLMTVDQGVWVETENSAYSPALRKPNLYQTRQQFVECWMLSKLLDGNAYILKERDDSRKVRKLHVLDPQRVTPLVAPDGSVYYRLERDDLSGLRDNMPAVPASEIIHDRMECLYHPLVGISPLFAVYLSAVKGQRIEQNAERFFRNQSQPGGMLTAPHTIDDGTAKRLQREFEQNFSGTKRGRLFVGGDGLEYKPIAESAVNSQLVEQLKLSAEQVCSVFHVPAYMIGAGTMPTYDNIEALTQQYYQQCLQKHFNAIEDLLDEGLGLREQDAGRYRTEFDLDDLTRMNPMKQAEVIERLSKVGVFAPDEGRAKFGALPVPGGKYPYMQQQNYSLEALAKRDAREDPFASAKTTPPPAAPSDDEAKAALESVRLLAALQKGLEHV